MITFAFGNFFENLTILKIDILLDFTALILALLIITISNKGLFSERLKKFCAYNSTLEFLSILIIITAFILFILNVFLVLITNLFIDYKIDFGMMVSGNNTTSNVPSNNDQDPVRWWPSGTTQSWACLGAALALHRTIPGSPRVKAAAALSSLGITIPLSIFTQAVESPNGFNKFMYCAIEYKRTGRWPLLSPERVVTDSDIAPPPPFGGGGHTSAEATELVKTTTTHNFLPDNITSNIFDFINNQLYLTLNRFFNTMPVEGYLDDLLGQQLFIHLLLLVVVMSTIVLFLIFLFIHFINYNKEYILTKFNNKYVKLYVRYQLFLSKLSLFTLPILIMIGLLQLFFGLYFLITHMIPYDSLGIDLHTYVSNSKSI